MKTLITLRILLCFSLFIMMGHASGAPISNGGRITGTVTDRATGLPIAGVSIFVPDLKTGTTTDAGGHYVLKHLPEGKYLVQIRVLGYADVTRVIDLARTYSMDFKLSTSRNQLSDVVVTAAGNTTTRHRSPIPITVVTHETILENTFNTAIDEIASQPGINETTEGAGTTKPQINGLGFDRVLTLMDGVPQEDFQWGDDHGILIDPYAVHEAEIIRGPASLQYGASAEAGVIGFKSDPFPESGVVRGSVLGEYHTNNGYIGTSWHVAGNHHGLVWDLRASGEAAHSYSDPKDGYVWGSAWNQAHVRLMLGVNKSWGYARLTLSALQRRIEVPGGNRDSTGRFEFNYPQNGRLYPSRSDYLSYAANIAGDKILYEYQSWWQNSVNLGKGKLAFDVGFTQSVHHDIDSGTAGRDNLLVNGVPYALKYQLNTENAWKITAGVSGLYEYHHNLKSPPLPEFSDYHIPNYTNSEVGIYAIVQKDFKNLTLSGGLRLDRTHFIGQPLSLVNSDMVGQRAVPSGTPGATIKFARFNNAYNGISASLGGSYQLPSNQYTKLNVSKSYRAPAINELTSNGLNIGPNAFQLGNSHLKAEDGYQVDVAYGYNGGSLSLEVDGFYNRISHFIFADRTDSVSQGNPVYQYVSSNVAVLTGVSAYLNIHPTRTKWLELNNGFTFIYTRIPREPDSANHVPWTPAPHLTTELKLRLKEYPRSALSHGYIKIGLTYDWAQHNVYRALYTELPSAAYALWNAGIGTNFVNPKSRRVICSLHINCTNLTNTPYADHLNLAQYFLARDGTSATVTNPRQGIYNMGRNFGFKIVFPFGTTLRAYKE